MSVVLSSGGSWTRQERNWARRAQEARLDSGKQQDTGGPGAPSPCAQTDVHVLAERNWGQRGRDSARGVKSKSPGVSQRLWGPLGCAASSQLAPR